MVTRLRREFLKARFSAIRPGHTPLDQNRGLRLDLRHPRRPTRKHELRGRGFGTHSVQPAGNPLGNQLSARDERVPADLRKDSDAILTSCWPRKDCLQAPTPPLTCGNSRARGIRIRLGKAFRYRYHDRNKTLSCENVMRWSYGDSNPGPLACHADPLRRSASEGVERGATHLQQWSGWVALGLRAPDHSGSHLWLPWPLGLAGPSRRSRPVRRGPPPAASPTCGTPTATTSTGHTTAPPTRPRHRTAVEAWDAIRGWAERRAKLLGLAASRRANAPSTSPRDGSTGPPHADCKMAHMHVVTPETRVARGRLAPHANSVAPQSAAPGQPMTSRSSPKSATSSRRPPDDPGGQRHHRPCRDCTAEIATASSARTSQVSGASAAAGPRSVHASGIISEPSGPPSQLTASPPASFRSNSTRSRWPAKGWNGWVTVTKDSETSPDERDRAVCGDRRNTEDPYGLEEPSRC